MWMAFGSSDGNKLQFFGNDGPGVILGIRDRFWGKVLYSTKGRKNKQAVDVRTADNPTVKNFVECNWRWARRCRFATASIYRPVSFPHDRTATWRHVPWRTCATGGRWFSLGTTAPPRHFCCACAGTHYISPPSLYILIV